MRAALFAKHQNTNQNQVMLSHETCRAAFTTGVQTKHTDLISKQNAVMCPGHGVLAHKTVVLKDWHQKK